MGAALGLLSPFPCHLGFAFAVKALSPVLGLLPVNQDGAGRKSQGINLALFDRLHQARWANL